MSDFNGEIKNWSDYRGTVDTIRGGSRAIGVKNDYTCARRHRRRDPTTRLHRHPSYNQAHFIEDTLYSVRNQTYDHVEHVVMDGGSEDGTVEILEEYEQYDDYDMRWVSEPDEGQLDAINRGFERADGEIVA